MLVAVHTANRAPGRLAVGSNATIFASMVLNAAATSNFATFTLTQMDENLEYNVWPHATRHVSVLPRADTPLRRDFGNLIPTNY
jgi:hypothetical protein